MHQVHIVISGKVQGVGFRYFVKSEAKKLGLTGWVYNTPFSDVEAVLQGEKKTIEQMINLCKQGPMLSEVKDIDMQWENVGERFSDFVIRKNSE